VQQTLQNPSAGIQIPNHEYVNVDTELEAYKKLSASSLSLVVGWQMLTSWHYIKPTVRSNTGTQLFFPQAVL
jgi:hypothetical protein